LMMMMMMMMMVSPGGCGAALCGTRSC
jgi:hypothetical protein